MSLSSAADFNFREEIASKKTAQWLTKSYKALVFVCIFQLFVQVGLIIWASTQCTTLLGLSLSGRIFHTDSFTCPIQGVSKLYSHR